MIISLTRFELPQPLTPMQARRLFETTAPTYRAVKGLHRKHYVLSEDGRVAGGVYLWASRADADALYTEAWRAFVRGKYGTEPSVLFYESAVTVDNLAGTITLG